MKTWLKSLVSVVLFAQLGTALASVNTVDSQTLQDRSNFLKAEKALQQGDRKHFSRLKQGLENYVLYPYLEYQELRRYLGSAKKQDIQDYLTLYADVPTSRLLRHAWLRHLARRGQWETFLEFYKPSSNVTYQCRHLTALIKTGQGEQAWADVEKLWLYGKSRPRECDPVFKAWQDAGKLSTNLVWQRIELAMQARRSSLARYLKRYLPQPEQAWVDRWVEIHKYPHRVSHKSFRRGQHPKKAAILAHGVKRLAVKDLDKARKQWASLKKKVSFSDALQAQVDRYIGIRMARYHKPGALEALEALPLNEQDAKVVQWRIRSALRQKNWSRAYAALEALPEKDKQEEHWRYWRARTLEQLGQKRDARIIYAGLSKNRDYYSFLSADRMGSDYHFSDSPIQSSEGELTALVQIPAIQRTRELLALQKKLDARREWRDVMKDMSEDQLLRAAKLAQRWGWHDRGIITVAKARHWDDLELRFPIAHIQTIRAQARNNQLPPSWVLAMMRQESAFNQEARSPVGAMGLMQIMPATAKRVAKMIKVKNHKDHKLYNPDYNIRLGTRYMRHVLDKLGNNAILATAAYNAGPHRVETWLPEKVMDADVWIETIPFTETRNYLKKVLMYTAIYEHRLGQTPNRLTSRMLPVSPTPGMITQAEHENQS